MTATGFTLIRRVALASAAALVVTALPAAPLLAQDAAVAKRIEKLEKEMRAVQRSVFPGGSPEFFEGEISGPSGTSATVSGATPLGDLTTRVDALERQLATLTGSSEQSAFKIGELEKQFAAFKADVNRRLTALEGSGASETVAKATPAPTPTPAAAKPAPTPTPVATPAATKPAAKPAPKPASTGAKPSDRVSLVKAVEVPSTGNERQDGYDYGFRLWNAKLYPEAQAQLKKVVERWPTDRIASRAQNLLGRAYLDEGKPSLAAVAFYNNYKDRPNGDRAPHSLMYMGIALDRLDRKADACKAFKELDEVYGTTMPSDVRSEAAAAKAKAGC
jgi:TolA-binding protein